MFYIPRAPDTEPIMQPLNYHHLYLFLSVAREGGIARAAESLSLTPQTVSGQLSSFEHQLGLQLFDRVGKRLVLNENGRLILGYAEDIFALGHELQQVLKNPLQGLSPTLRVGVTDVIPKVMAFDILKHTLATQEPLKLISKESDLDSLLAELALNRLDLIFSDRPLTPGGRIKAYGHMLGESGMAFFSNKALAKRLRAEFPASLDGESFLISGEKSTQHLNLMTWFNENSIAPNIVAEFDDSALMKHFGQEGYGVFAAPIIIAKHLVSRYGVAEIVRTTEITERYYAISPARKIANHGGQRIMEYAKQPLN